MSTKIEWVKSPDGSAASVENGNFVTQPLSRSLNLPGDSAARTSPVFGGEPRHNLSVRSFHDEKWKQRGAQQAGPLSMEPDYMLRFPLRVPTPGSRIVQFDGSGMDLGLKPLDNLPICHAHSHRRVEGQFFRPNVADSDAAFAVDQAGNVGSFDLSKQGYRVWRRRWLPCFCSQIFSAPSFRFRRIDFVGWHDLIVVFREA